MIETEEKRQTSEDMLGISPQPKETCPMIDAVIRNASDALKAIKRYDRTDDVDELKEMISSAEWEVDQIEDDMERIRQHVIEIRNWGQEWKDLALKLQDDLDEMEGDEP